MADRLGTQVGNYRLSQLLGQGSFAEVYLGVHLHLGTQAAIKLLHAPLASASEVEKFRQEARTIATLIHPHIVRVLDFGVEAGLPYLVLDYAPGGSLRVRHPSGTLVPLATVVTYIRQIAQALQYAHDQKVIHRDVKPQNLLAGRNGEILLSDFGISVVAESTSRQQAQGFAGTVAYSAPEQLQEHPRPASDQYALGVVVYEWLTGTLPFTGAFQEIIAKHLFVAPPPLREHLKSLPAPVEQVVLTALAKDPKERFASVSAFARALEQANTISTPALPVMAPAQSQPPPGSTPASTQAPHPPGGAFAMTEVPPATTPNVSRPTRGQPAALASSTPAESGAEEALSPRWQQAPAPPSPLVSTWTFLPPPTAPALGSPAPARPGETSRASPTHDLSTPSPGGPLPVGSRSLDPGSQAPSSTSEAYAPSEPPLVQRKSQRGRWIALAILAVVLVAGGVAYFVANQSGANQSSPTQAAQARCADVRNGDWSDFYTHSTSALQGQFGPKEQFVANQEIYVNSHSGVVSCTITTLNQNDSTATGTGVVTYGDGSQDTFDYQEVLENGEWELSQDVRRGG